MIRRLVGLLFYACALVIIGLAIVVGVGRALAPHADEMRPWLEVALTDRLGLPVAIERVEAHWPRLTPQLQLNGVRVGEPDAPLASIDSASLDVHLPGLAGGAGNLFDLTVIGLDVELTEDEDGSWGLQLVRGGQLGGGDGLPAERVLTGNLLLREVEVRIQPQEWPATAWHLPEAELERSAERTALIGRIHPQADAASVLELRLLADHAAGSLEAIRAWFGLPGLDLGADLFAPFVPEAVDTRERLLQADLWLDWSRESGAGLSLDFALTGGEDEAVSGTLLAERIGRRVDLNLPEMKIGDEPVVSGLALAWHDRRAALAFDALDLDRLHRLLAPVSGLLPWWPERLEGQVDSVSLMLDLDESLHAVNGRIRELVLAPTGPVPGVEGLDLELGLAGDRVVLSPSGPATVMWPQQLRESVELDAIAGQLLLAPEGIEMRELSIAGDIVSARADGWIYLGPERPFLDFGIDVQRIEAGDPRPWLPRGIVPPRALEWLEQSLVHVDHASGQLLFHMRAGQRAADFDPGDFQAEIDFAGARMDYWPEWPLARLHEGQVRFLGRSLYGQVPSAHLGESTLSVDQVVIGDLTQPELVFLATADDADATALAATLADMPVAGWQALFDQTRWSGSLAFATEVTLPLRQMSEWHLDGEVEINDARVALPALGIELSALHGAAFFDRHRIVPTALQARAGQRMLTLDLAADFDAPTRLDIGAELHPADLLADDELADLVARHVTGTTFWRLGLDAVEDGLSITLESDLEGIGFELPEPANKLMPQSWPFRADVRLVDQDIELDLSLAESLEMAAWREAGDWTTTVGLHQPRPARPDNPGTVVRGQLNDLDLGAWVSLIDALPLPDARGVGRADIALSLGRLAWENLSIDAVELGLVREEGAWEASFDGDGARGRATIPSPLDSGRVLAVDLARLHLDHDRPEPDPTQLIAELGPGQTSTASPVGYPPLHLLIEDLRYRDLDLGRVRVESHATDSGVEIERVEASGETLSLQGRGRWVEGDAGPYSEFEGRLITDSLTELMTALGYEIGIQAARAQADLAGRWPGAPHDFSLQRLDGALDIEVSDGLIPEARPGAGRLLGLISISTIPRRLTLDFRDVFAQGLKFDRIEGRFRIADGVASTDELLIDAPAASIKVSGETDLIDRRYDQYLVVEPGVGGTLPLIGGLAGGPMGAAAGLVLQTLFDGPLRGIAEARYAVTGAWEAPEVDLVEARVTDEEGEERILLPEELDLD
ncbi:hypothetical protein IC757_13880 [Wenzhouxiangella sp. AB-CW3]|uniref:YhdP family phospholipid transporter n=1 Tax=Wenzhouxiangella sp. AB-CW3 TaxID=2771012 RepID=UPI00168B5654|nr:AsmA-like C-terminal region-containing protein [Wenzhouxiangella sp. AB-CW3]QOC22097.1 hypothetical protein IC757_13880 [Wenzhouxiangella sp. AB-CW3]